MIISQSTGISEWYLGVYWGGRDCSIKSGVGKLLQFLTEIERISQVFKGLKTLQKNIRATPGNAKKIEAFIETNELSLKGKRSPDPVLGYSLYLNSRDTFPFLRYRFGVQSEFSVNSCSVSLGDFGNPVLSSLTSSQLLQALRVAAIVFEPQHGRISSVEFNESLGKKHVPFVKVGWATYLSNDLLSLGAIPACCEVQVVEKLGAIVTSTSSINAALESASIRCAKALVRDAAEANWTV